MSIMQFFGIMDILLSVIAGLFTGIDGLFSVIAGLTGNLCGEMPDQVGHDEREPGMTGPTGRVLCDLVPDGG